MRIHSIVRTPTKVKFQIKTLFDFNVNNCQNNFVEIVYIDKSKHFEMENKPQRKPYSRTAQC